MPAFGWSLSRRCSPALACKRMRVRTIRLAYSGGGSRNLHEKAQNKLSIIGFAESVQDLRAPAAEQSLEKLLDDRCGQHSIRINDRYRICFRWIDGGAKDVEVVDYH